MPYTREMTLADNMSQKKKKKKEGRGYASIEDSVDVSKQRLKDYIKKSGGWLITATRNNTDKHVDLQSRNNHKTKIGRKTTVGTF